MTKPGFAGSAEQKTTAWTLAAVGKLPLAHSRWTAYGKAGIPRWESKASYRNDSAYTGNTAATRHGVSPLIGLGVEYTLSDRWTARAGLERQFRPGERAQLLDWAAPQTLRTTNADATTVMLGVAYRF